MAIMQIEVPDPPPFPTGMIETDGVPMESEWHRLAMHLLLDVIAYRLRDRQDYFAGGNMFLYFNEEQVRSRDYRGPDFFFVWGRPLNPTRPYWAVWQEGGRYPDLIVELSSPSTAANDLTEKKDLYEKVFRTKEYFVYDPSDQSLVGWRMINGHYVLIGPAEQGRLWCETLDLWIGTWSGEFQGKQGTYLRFFDETGQIVPTGIEAESHLKNVERQRAETERQRAEVERQRAEVERQRAETAEAELAKLKAQMTTGGKNSNP